MSFIIVLVVIRLLIIIKIGVRIRLLFKSSLKFEMMISRLKVFSR